MLPVTSRDGHDKRVISNLLVNAAPCRHVGLCVGPADSDAALVGCLPSITSAAHPVVVAQRHNADAILLCQLHGAVHGFFGI